MRKSEELSRKIWEHSAVIGVVGLGYVGLPLACAAASAGAALSGFLLARKLKKQMLLCGLGSGVFWAACQSVAAIAMNGQDLLQGGNLMLPIALLLGGILGGALAAVWAVR